MINFMLQILNKLEGYFSKAQGITYLLVLLVPIFFIQCGGKDSVMELPTSINLMEEYQLESNEDLDFIRKFEFAKDGSIWVGTFKSGVYHLSGGEIINYNNSNSLLANNTINDLFIDNLDRVWVATNEGFAKYENETWVAFTMANTPLILPHVTQIAVNNLDEILLGNGSAQEGGLVFRNRYGNWKNYTTNNSELPCSFILDIKLSSNSFWVSTGQLLGEGGIIKLENEHVTNLLNIENSGLLYNWIDNIEVRDEHIWTGYEVAIYNESAFPDGGIQRINLQSNSVTDFFPFKTGLISNRITSMKLHSDNSLWFTTSVDDPGCKNCFAGIGVLLENENILAVSALNSDIPSNAFFTELKEDNLGNMYASSELSLFRLELQ